MSGRARKLRRAANRRAHSNEVPQELIDAAVASLEFDEQQSTAAIDELCEVRPRSELGDALAARLLEVTELVYGSQPDLPEARAQIEERRGPGFLARVSAMGRPAAEVLSSHKIQAGNYRHHSPEWYRTYHQPGRLLWIQSRGNFGSFGRRFSSRRFSPTGYGRGGSSSPGRVNRLRSSCVGAGGASALEVSRATSRISRSNGPAAQSSARRGALPSDKSPLRTATRSQLRAGERFARS